jgi:hypothetical protein
MSDESVSRCFASTLTIIALRPLISFPYIRDEEILDSIKTHVLKKVARIGRFRRFTWRVRCERHRRFCRSS